MGQGAAAADHPLLQFDNVIASPHTAGVTREARANMGRIAAEQLLMTLDGKRPPRIVNPQVWPAYAKRFERDLRISPGRVGLSRAGRNDGVRAARRRRGWMQNNTFAPTARSPSHWHNLCA